MKKLIVKFSTYAMIIGLPMLILSSCEKDPCEDVTCENSGTPTEDGDNCTCVCGTNYEGTKCETLVRAKFIGSFNGTEACTSGNDTYAVTVTAGSGDGDVIIGNLYNAGFFVNATVNATGGLTIASQSFGTGTVSGSATISGNTLTVTYTVASGGLSDSCTGTYTK
jgi:hypothetical protein